MARRAAVSPEAMQLASADAVVGGAGEHDAGEGVGDLGPHGVEAGLVADPELGQALAPPSHVGQARWASRPVTTFEVTEQPLDELVVGELADPVVVGPTAGEPDQGQLVVGELRPLAGEVRRPP